MMRTVLLTFLIAVSTVLHGMAQDSKVTLKMKDVSLVKVLKTIEAQTPYKFSYRNAVVDKINGISVDYTNETVSNVLDKLLPPLELGYKMESEKSISIIQNKQKPKQNMVFAGGEVMDGFLGIALPQAKITVLSADSTVIGEAGMLEIKNRRNRVEHAQFHTTLPTGQKYLFHAVLHGYDDAWLSAYIPDNANGAVFVGDIKMQRLHKKQLDEVVVTATKIKMFWKGDTIVYNADAFNLPEGSMLDDMIRQMPGVTMNEHGEIFVNGRKVDELLLGSRSFFRGKSEVLLKNLPYYTVKNVKVYEKTSDLSQAMGYEVEPKKYVMDVNLKQEYNRGMIANVEAAAGNSDRYLGRAFLLGFSDPFRVSVVGNINNVNERRHIGESDKWRPEKMPKSMLTTRSVASEINFKNQKLEETFNIDYSSTSDRVDMVQRREMFIADSKPLSIFQSNGTDRNRLLKLRSYTHIQKPWSIVELNYRYRTFSSRSFSSTEQFDESSLTNSISDMGFGDGHARYFSGRLSETFPIGKNQKSSVGFQVEYIHDVENSENMKRFDFTVPAGNPLHNINEYQNHNSKANLSLNYSIQAKNGMTFLVNEIIRLSKSKKHDYLYHPDTLLLPSQCDALSAITDFANSYDSRYHINHYTTNLTLRKIRRVMPTDVMPYPMDYILWGFDLQLDPTHRSLHYHRGKIDTHITSTDFIVKPSIILTFHPENKYDRSINLTASHYNSVPSLYDLIDYRDDSQPLVVKSGNPGLKGDRVTKVGADYYSRGVHKRLLHVGLSLDYYHRSTAQSVIYDPLTGVYTYRPVNVNGNYFAKLNVDLTRTFGENRLWTFGNNADGVFNRSVDYTMLQGMTESRLNKVNTLIAHDGLYLQFEKNGFNVRASGDIKWRHSTGQMVDFTTLNATDWNYGMSARYTIPGLKTTVSADGTVYSRRGYGSSLMNTNDFVVNASVSQPMMNVRLVARLEAFDLLHNLSQTQYDVNAQGRTETWYRSLPHYVMLHMVYQFNISPIKK